VNAVSSPHALSHPNYAPSGPYDIPFSEMPRGFLLRVIVPLDTTPPELSAFLMANNVPVEPERISMRDFRSHRSAAISLPYEVIAHWIEWSLSETPFRGMQLLKVTPFTRLTDKANA
jgi:hypothetical protein